MTFRSTFAGLGALAALVVAAAWPLSSAAADTADTAAATQVTIVHGLRGLVADVYLDGDVALEGFAAERVTEPMAIPAGEHEVAIRASGAAAGSKAAVSGQVDLPASGNVSLVAHLAADGTPTLTQFGNDVSDVGSGEGRLVVRHVGAAKDVSVSVDGDPRGDALSTGDETSLDLPAGSHTVSVAVGGAGDGGVGPRTVEVPAGDATVLYLIGSQGDSSLGWLVQMLDGLGGFPSGVPTGGTPPRPAIPETAVVVALLSLAVAVVLPRPRLLSWWR
jgi:hypothetical protein